MRVLVLAALLAVLSASSPAADLQPARDMPVVNPGSPATAECPPISRFEAMRRGGKLSPKMLDELPAADLYKAVYRRIGDCVAPIIVQYNLGTGTAQRGR